MVKDAKNTSDIMRPRRDRMKLRIILLLLASVAIWMLCFWQLEMVWVGYTTGWGYRFWWFPRNFPFGEVWFWRDLWWMVEFLAYGLGVYAAYKLGITRK